jgi:hypothetical protein
MADLPGYERAQREWEDREPHDGTDAALQDAYAEGRKDEHADCIPLIAWAYGKLHHINFTKQEDALMLDRIKLLLEHGVHA